MDFLNPLINQVRELFASMTAGARLTAGLLLAVVVVSLGFLFQQATVGPDQFLFGGDPIGRERLPRIEAVLGNAGIDFDTVGSRIKVSHADRNAAIGAIGAAGELPPEHFSIMDEALKGGGMFDFREQKMQRIRAAHAARASLELSRFPWLESARVINRVRDKNGLMGGRHATAAVSVMPHPGEEITTKRLRVIKDYVAKACDVPMENISIMNLAGDLYAGGEGVSADDFDHPYYKLKAKQEDRTESKIRRALSFIPGVLVEVNATLNDVAEQTESVVTPENEAVALSTSSNKTTDEQTVALPGDPVGVEVNGPAGIPREGNPLARQEQSKSTSNNKESQSVVGTRERMTVTAGYTLKEVDASIGVPMAYVEDVYRQKNLDEDGNEPEEIDEQVLDALRLDIQNRVEGTVQPLLPRLSLGEDKFRQVKVNFFDGLPQEPIPGPSAASNALGWVGSHVNTLAMAGLAVFGLVMLRSVVNGAKESPVTGLPALQLDGEPLAEGSGGGDDEEARPKLKLRKPETLKDDLTEMVSSDPDAAAAILKSWINNAA